MSTKELLQRSASMDWETSFRKLISSGGLAHGYILFGGPELEFVRKLANFLEDKKWQLTERPLLDFLIISPDEKGIISIDAVRIIKGFLWQKPLLSCRKTLVIDQASSLTLPAQNAVLKIAEEPPATSLIFLLLPDPDVLVAPLTSRFQKIYFPHRLSQETSLPEAKEFLKGNHIRKNSIIKMVVSDDVLLKKFVEAVMLELDKDPVKNFAALKELSYRWSLISRYNTNKRLQLESWSLIFNHGN